MTRSKDRFIRLAGLTIAAILMIGGLPLGGSVGPPSDLVVRTAEEFPAAVLSDVRELNLAPSGISEETVPAVHGPRAGSDPRPDPADDGSPRSVDRHTGPGLRAPPNLS